MRTKTKALAIAGAIALSLFAYTHEAPTHSTPTLTPVIEASPHYIDQAAIITALTESSELVGLTGTVEKTVGYSDSKWYGDKEYEMTARGTFKLGINTEDIEIATDAKEYRITVRFPLPKLIALDMPFDIADIRKDVGILRDDITEAELQALYGKAREGAVASIMADEEAFRQAEASVRRSIEELIGMVTDRSGAADIEIIFERESTV